MQISFFGVASKLGKEERERVRLRNMKVIYMQNQIESLVVKDNMDYYDLKWSFALVKLHLKYSAKLWAKVQRSGGEGPKKEDKDNQGIQPYKEKWVCLDFRVMVIE